MRKLTLDPDALHVESFTVDGRSSPGGGTVQGQSYHEDPDPGTGGGGWGSLWNCPTQSTCIGPTYCCEETWRPSCVPSCNGESCDTLCWTCPL